MSNGSTGSPPPVPPYLGPGSPQNVPPPPGRFPIDPATLPQPLQDELLAPDPVAIDTSDQALKDGLNRCPKCGATDIQQKPGSDLLICLYCRNEWHGQRVEEEFALGEGIDQLQRLMLPRDLPGGEYRVLAGIYDREGGSRWPATRDGQPARDDLVPLMTFTLPEPPVVFRAFLPVVNADNAP